ncbi:uncharacterized protein LOC105223255 isoform X2 [Bactrocera dorsalis]|uniref:Uncharacterized protein LOC105223255 isoform X2 n=1 Tax=Bactrocera dorsalis TaxID=27457 RepID=A0ABM3JRT3_BACDO|nr:uncharacterized protein LOC105223255 isoform X2 [Bactrocera dorsalis]
MMKHKGSSYCCRWFTLFLLAMGIVLVSPDIHTNFADNNKQTTTKGTTKGTTATTTTTIMSTTTTTTMQANTMRTMKMLEAMGFIDGNRYNVNDKNDNNNNNNNNLNNYHSNMLIANSNRNSKNSNKMYISAPSKQELWRQQLQQLADRASPAEKVEQEPELEQELEEHMVSTPQSMTIMVEKPTTSPAAAAATTTTIKPKTTTIINPKTIATKTLSVSTATKLAASKPTTTTITIATSAITTRHSGSTIKLPPDNMANINVSGINARGTVINKQQLQRQNEQQQLQQPQKQQQHWQHERRQQQQQQPQHAQTLVVVAGNRRAEQPQKYIGHTLSGDSGSTQASAAMIVATPVRRGGELANVTATAQTQIAINGKSKSSNSNNNNRNSDIVDGITTPITATTTTRITIVDTFIITPTPPPTTTTKTLTTQSKQFESARILYDYKATDATDDLKRTTETDAQMIVAGHEEMEVVRQYQHKFSSSYLDAAGNKDHAAVAHYGNTHSFAALVQMSAKQQQQQQRQQQQRNRWVRQAEEEPIDKCRKFNEGDAAKNEFYSPDYPNDYPKNISCTRVIIAPPGQIIRLDFRNSFHIEAKEECKFDVLEIRDGQYGFSNLLGKFCGTDFPPEITSKERYLWLHFQSDESIEYSGFTAVYEFMDRSKEAPTTDLNCTIEKSGFEDFVNSTDVPEDIRDTVIKNRVPLDCIWRIQVQENWKIQMKFVDFRLVKPNDCEANFLDIFPEQTIMPLRKKNFCGSAGEGITSDSNTLNIRFFAEPAAINSTFSILFTAFRDKGSGSCTDEEYDCEDATCIDRKLRCNSRDNCKFRWDEEGCNKETSEVSEHIYIIMVVFGLILGGMILTFLVNCIRKIMHDQKIIREIPLPHASDIYHIDSFIWDAPKTAIFVGLQNDYMSEHNWQLHQQQQQQQQQQVYMLQQAQQAQPHPHGSQQQLDDNGNCNGQRQIPSQSQSQSQSNGDGSTSGGSGSGSGSAFNSHYSNHRGGGGVGAYVGCHTTSKQDGNDNLYIHGLNCDNANGSCSACTYQPNVVNFNDDEFVIVTNRNGREYPLGGGCGAGAYPPELLANSYGYDVTPVSTDSITSSKSSPTTATN